MKIAPTLLIAVLSIWSGNRSHAIAAEKPVSKFTSTEQKSAVKFIRERGEPSDFHGLYRGFAGYDLEFVGGDARSWINVRYGRMSVDLRDTTMDQGVGIGFLPHKADDKVEWRGFEKNGQFVPYAIIYRIVAVTENGRPSETRLVVIRLNKQRSRIIGHADGPNAEAEAEQIADRSHEEQ